MHIAKMVAMLETAVDRGVDCNFEYGPSGVDAKIRDSASATTLSTPGICSSVKSLR